MSESSNGLYVSYRSGKGFVIKLLTKLKLAREVNGKSSMTNTNGVKYNNPSYRQLYVAWKESAFNPTDAILTILPVYNRTIRNNY